MDTNQILADLRAERDHLDQAITAFELLDSTGSPAARRGRPPAVVAQLAPTQARGGHRHISAAGRRRIAEAARKMWARRKKAVAASKPATAAKKAAPARHMSVALRKRLSELAKKRWAKRKKAAKAAQ